MRSTLRRVTFSIALAITLALGLGSPPPVQAVASRTTCSTDYMWCMVEAIREPDDFRYFLKAMDCGVDLVACIRHSID
jgi:hypothetical protein